MPANNDGRDRRRWRLLIALCLGAAISGAGWTLWTSHASSAATAKKAAPTPVNMALATQMDYPVWLDAIGSMTSVNAVNVPARVNGQIETLAFSEGQMVKEGDLLAVIDPRPFQMAVNQSLAQLAQEEAKLASNQVDLKRAQDLAKEGAGPTQNVDTMRSQVAIQKAVVQAARAALENAQLQLEFTRITSPISGRAGQIAAPVGTLVRSTDATGITTVTQIEPIWGGFLVPQDVLPDVMEQLQVRPLKVQAWLRDRSQQIGEGALEFVDNQVTTGVGQIQLKARFDNPEQLMWPGQLVSIRMLLRTEKQATLAPQEAVQQGENGLYVYVVDAQNMARFRPVDAGGVVDGMQWIRSGLAPGEKIVTLGQYRVSKDSLVTDAALAATDQASIGPAQSANNGAQP